MRPLVLLLIFRGKKRDKVLLLELPGNGGDRDLRRLGTVHHVDVSFYIQLWTSGEWRSNLASINSGEWRFSMN